MGIFSWIGVKIKELGKAIAKGYKNYSGQSTFEEADALYEEISKKFAEHKVYFEQQVDEISSEIENQINKINSSKKTIKMELFPSFASKIQRIKNVTVSDEFMKDIFSGSTLKIDDIRKKEELYLIDFKKNPFKCNALAIVTLGIATRKKAKETLLKVKEERKRLEEEMARMDSEIIKLKDLKNSLMLIADFYESLINLYRALLLRLDNSVNFLVTRCLSLIHKITESEMSIEKLPISQQKEIMNLVTITKILKEMVLKNITMEGKIDTIFSSVNDVKEDIRNMKKEIIYIHNAA